MKKKYIGPGWVSKWSMESKAKPIYELDSLNSMKGVDLHKEKSVSLDINVACDPSSLESLEWMSSEPIYITRSPIGAVLSSSEDLEEFLSDASLMLTDPDPEVRKIAEVLLKWKKESK